MQTHLLDKTKSLHSEWKEGLVKNTLLVVALLLEEKTVNLWKLKGSVGKLLGNTDPDSRSHYQRLKRWLNSGLAQKRLWVVLLQASVGLLTKKSKCLIIDGTSWQTGTHTYHFLTLSVLYEGVSVPIFWLDLKRLGISSQWHRKLLLRLALKVFVLKGKVLLGDREYIGQEWFEWLQEAGLELVIRLRKGNYEEHIEKSGKRIVGLERKAKARLGSVVFQKFLLEDKPYTLVLMAYRERSGKTQFLRLITTLTPALAIKYYACRYRIESMFKHLKSNGFQLQDLNLKTHHKITLLLAALVLAYTLSVVHGLARYKRAIKVKKHGSPEMSLFRFGLDLWQNHLQSFVRFLEALAHFNISQAPTNQPLLNLNVP
ncbi:MAG: transposase [Cytophagales bacterium]|nr:transposase [Cytophagales bacterium]